MRVRNAYVVYIDFDGDIYSDVEGRYIFTTIEETESIVERALIDLKSKNVMKVYIDGHVFDLDDVIDDANLLSAFIECGGCEFGNWTISVDKVE